MQLPDERTSFTEANSGMIDLWVSLLASIESSLPCSVLQDFQCPCNRSLVALGWPWGTPAYLE
jgi:hypothetical protein